jgi:heme/copper-type cytochrome/quinol oxidase subunit 3
MSEKKPEFAMWFHKFLIYGMLWICGIGLILLGIHNTHIGIEDGVSPLVLVILMQVILAASGIAIIKARFDLAKMKASGLKLLLIAFLAAAVALFVDWRI